ncbi:MAG: hypothetical protein KIT27_12370 [Legionellales bacterium]|nr:hypothetical protein [Legionellales bacterium]
MMKRIVPIFALAALWSCTTIYAASCEYGPKSENIIPVNYTSSMPDLKLTIGQSTILPNPNQTAGSLPQTVVLPLICISDNTYSTNNFEVKPVGWDGAPCVFSHVLVVNGQGHMVGGQQMPQKGRVAGVDKDLTMTCVGHDEGSLEIDVR